MHFAHIQSLNQHYDHIYVSPHFDDVAASCGGRISNQLQTGEKVLVVTVFTALAADKKRLHDRVLKSIADYDLRRVEDTNAMQRLGADFIWLGYPEFLLRSQIPLSRYWPIFRITHSNRRLCNMLRSDLDRLCRKTGCRNLIMPMAVGQHMDHQIVFEVGVDLIRQETNDYGIGFYEDYPYTLLPGMLTYRMKITGMAVHRPWNHDNLMQKYMRSSARDAYRLLSNMPSFKMNYYLVKPLAFLAVTLFQSIAQHLMRPRPDILGDICISPQVCDISTVIDLKIQVILAYPSQLSNPLFTKRRIKDILTAYARVMGLPRGCFGERYWYAALSSRPNPD